MKTIFAITLMMCGFASADTYVNGYVNKNGTYVNGYYRSNSDNSTYNNYSTQGNTNPYSGQQGTVNPYSSYGNNHNTYYTNPYRRK